MNELTHLDLCAGWGEFAWAFEREGFKTVGFCETNPICSSWLASEWPHVRNYGDVANLPPVRCAVLSAGFPCQDISNCGPKTGLAGARSSVWFGVRDAVDRCGPSVCLFENSAAIVGRGLDRVCSDMEALGYSVRPFRVAASALGAPHARPRVLIVAYAAGIGQPGQGGCIGSGNSTPDAFREADRLVDAFQRNALPFVCRGHDGFRQRASQAALHIFGNSVVSPIAQIFARAIKSTLTPPTPQPEKVK